MALALPCEGLGGASNTSGWGKSSILKNEGKTYIFFVSVSWFQP